MQRRESPVPRSGALAGKFSRHGPRRPSGGWPLKSAIFTIAIPFLATWASSTTIYILFNDDALKYLVERQVSITREYETQAAALQTEIDRLRSIKLIDQERVDRTVSDLARRQTVIELRQSALTALAGTKSKSLEATAQTTGPLRPANLQNPASVPAPKPSPLSDTILVAPAGDRWSRLESRPLMRLASPPNARDARSATETPLVKLGRDLQRVQTELSMAMNELEVNYDDRKRRMRQVLIEIGVPPAPSGVRFEAGKEARTAVGGPFQPWPRPADDDFARQLHRIRSTATAVAALEREIGAIPVRRPTTGAAAVTSGFGVRLDPFLRQPAMHTGIDFRGESGDPVYATAAGNVVQAERNGGYGLMVEVDHGNGLATRYAHLSAIAVREGASVAPGDLIGQIGSTGRSTGPHLHYEVRQLGEATDPQRFLRAGLRLEHSN